MLKGFLDRHPSQECEATLSRRGFIKQLAGGALLTLAGPDLAHAAKLRFPAHKTLAFANVHTGDRLKLTYYEKGRYIKSALHEIDYLLRDYRNGQIHRIDIYLLDQLHDLKQLMNLNKPFDIISGYRSPATNRYLHDEGHGAANHSLHMQGRAIDIRVDGVACRHIRNAALTLRRGGVGYYPDSDFVHLDTGKIRYW